MDPQYQAELDALVQRPRYKMHGMWHKAPDVVENVKLANMLHNEWIMEEDIACILMLSSVITCPSMTSLFCNLLKSALLRTDDHPRDAALDIMAQFHERGLPAIAKQEIEAFTINSWRDIPSALHINRVVSGFRSNRGKIIKFCQKLATATTDRSLFNERAVFGDLHNKLSKCGVRLQMAKYERNTNSSTKKEYRNTKQNTGELYSGGIPWVFRGYSVGVSSGEKTEPGVCACAGGAHWNHGRCMRGTFWGGWRSANAGRLRGLWFVTTRSGGRIDGATTRSTNTGGCCMWRWGGWCDQRTGCCMRRAGGCGCTMRCTTICRMP
jgi:hypothetical protein